MLRPRWRQADHWCASRQARILPAQGTAYAVNSTLLWAGAACPCTSGVQWKPCCSASAPFPLGTKGWDSAERSGVILNHLKTSSKGTNTKRLTEMYSFLRILEQEQGEQLVSEITRVVPAMLPRSVLTAIVTHNSNCSFSATKRSNVTRRWKNTVPQQILVKGKHNHLTPAIKE